MLDRVTKLAKLLICELIGRKAVFEVVFPVTLARSMLLGRNLNLVFASKSSRIGLRLLLLGLLALPLGIVGAHNLITELVDFALYPLSYFRR